MEGGKAPLSITSNDLLWDFVFLILAALGLVKLEFFVFKRSTFLLEATARLLVN